MSRTLRMAAIGLAALVALPARAEDKAKSVEGAWRQVEHRNGDAKEYQKLPEGVEMTYLIVGGRFAWSIVQEGKILGLAGGRYKWEKGKFTEMIEFASGEAAPPSFVGSTFEFAVELDGDTMHRMGTIVVKGKDFKIDTKWERCKP
jgi:hypothetical protein